MLVLATDVLYIPNDRAGIKALLDEMKKDERCPDLLMADAGYAGRPQSTGSPNAILNH